MKLVTALLAPLILLSVRSALAGPSSDGGGKGVLCKSEKGSQLEALDIWEAKNIYRFGEAPRQGSVYAEYAFAFARFDEAQRGPNKPVPDMGTEADWKEAYERDFGGKIIEIPPGRRLPATMDATLPILPMNCEYVQVALFNTLGVQLDKEYWGMMDARNQAAIVFHELLYPYRRKYGATNSDETRRFVGQLFSLKPPVPRFLSVPKTGYLECRAGGSTAGPVYDFVIYPTTESGKPTSVISFRQLDNATLLGRMTAEGSSNIIEAIVNGGVSLGATLTSESHDETRSFNLATRSENGVIYITVGTRDNYTGVKSAEAKGFCELK